MDNIGNFVELKKSSKLWAIGSIHSNLNSFNSIKNYIMKNFSQNDEVEIIFRNGEKISASLSKLQELI